jgi:hypothetical protein
VDKVTVIACFFLFYVNLYNYANWFTYFAAALTIILLYVVLRPADLAVLFATGALYTP